MIGHIPPGSATRYCDPVMPDPTPLRVPLA